MKMVFLDTVNVTPDERNWVILSNDDNVRVMRSRNDTVSIPGTYSYIAVTTFRLGTTPSEAYNFLTRHLVEIQVHVITYSFCFRNEVLFSYIFFVCKKCCKLYS